MLNVDVINLALAVVSTITLSFGFIVFLTDNISNRKNRTFSFFIFSVFAWAVTMFAFRSVESVEAATIWARFLYLSATSIGTTFVLLAYIFTDEEYVFSKRQKLLIFLPFVCMSVIDIMPNALIQSVIFVPGQENTIIFTQFWHIVYAIHFSLFATWAFVVFFKKYRKTSGLQHTQLMYVIFGSLVTAITGTTTNLTMPLLGNFQYNWVGQITIMALVSAIFYAMVRHKLFNAKIISTEILVFVLWGFLVTRVLVWESQVDLIIDLVVLIGVIIVGAILIRGVIKEVKQRELLAIANRQLKELNMEKSEFLSIASHQLKSPITVILGYADVLKSGSYGEQTEKAKETLDRIMVAAKNQVETIDDFLNIGRIDRGEMKYDLGQVDMKKLVIESVTDLKRTSESRDLSLTYEINHDDEFNMVGDIGKLKQVITNLVDNSIKYTKAGSVKVILTKKQEGKVYRVDVADTGMGMSPDTIKALFRRFSRAKNIGKSQISGSGLGLYVVKQMVEAHKGRVWAESAGEGKGSHFIVELPSDLSEDFDPNTLTKNKAESAQA